MARKPEASQITDRVLLVVKDHMVWTKAREAALIHELSLSSIVENALRAYLGKS